MGIILQLNEALSCYIILQEQFILALCEFILNGQMDVKLIISKYSYLVPI